MPWISISELSKLTGVSPRVVRHRCEGLNSKPGARRAILFDSKAALPKVLAPVLPRNDDELSLTQERAKLAAAQTVRAKLETEKMRRESIPVEEVRADYEFLATTMLAGLQPMPGRLAEELADATHAGQVREILTREIRLIRRSIAEVIQRRACELAANGDSKVTKK